MLLADLCGSKELATADAHRSTGMSDGSGLPSYYQARVPGVIIVSSALFLFLEIFA